MTKPYEMMVLLHPDLEIDLEKPLDQIKSIVKNRGGEVTKADSWGKRRLAYPINGQEFAVYVLIRFDAEGGSVSRIDGDLNILPECIRHLIVSFDPKANAERQAQQAKAEERADGINAKDVDGDVKPSTEEFKELKGVEG